MLIYVTFSPCVGVEQILERLSSTGIACERARAAKKTDCWICRRGRISFELWASKAENHELDVMFLADTSNYRWWNFPIVWVFAVVSTRAELRLQRDALQSLRDLPHPTNDGNSRWFDEFAIGITRD